MKGGGGANKRQKASKRIHGEKEWESEKWIERGRGTRGGRGRGAETIHRERERERERERM